MDKFKTWMMDFDIYPSEMDVLIEGGFSSYIAISCISDEMVGKLYTSKDTVQKIRMAIYQLKKDMDKYSGTTTSSPSSPAGSSASTPVVPTAKPKAKAAAKAAAKTAAATKETEVLRVEKTKAPEATKKSKSKTTTATTTTPPASTTTSPSSAAKASNSLTTSSAPSPTLSSKQDSDFKSSLTKTSMGKRCKDCHDIAQAGHKDICEKQCSGFDVCQYIKGHPEITDEKKKVAQQLSDVKKAAKQKEKELLEEKKNFLENVLPAEQLPTKPIEWVNMKAKEKIDMAKKLGIVIDDTTQRKAKEAAKAEWVELRDIKKATDLVRKEIKKSYTVQVIKDITVDELKNAVNSLIAKRVQEYKDAKQSGVFASDTDEVDSMLLD
ncbi:hypothetical protein PPL_04834 [Heterostelium album PN500]|uniref:Uncharacterized protein n=1 Tax=Heterostelium pallidum (strain ATCC 26659 / Pp 5 / PN500) TaxID=670386 RepID=D3B8P1_HETP5|nr:hypothetical protein PPL_04834 [Heterostelium album PN500]EFA82409.1 hypothetical protein PPL_04834 [Heterostelium album PN500]|eukprot:XP_020434526.1 hypothetical protein PPL_04834 [Heterostelium album PN500]